MKLNALSLCLLVACCDAAAEDPQAARSLLAVQLSGASLANLEGAFWVCDYTATKRRASDDQIGMCTATYDALKERKFGGDFDALLLWWQKNRAAEHARLEAMDRPRQ
jgi:hypothetical protein